MNFKLEINLDNAAFGDTPFEVEAEVKRIFNFYIGKLDLTKADGMTVWDYNGNVVGTIDTQETE